MLAGDADLDCSFCFLPYQLDQVLELIRLRVEVVDQEGLELLCGGGWRRRGRVEKEGGEREVERRKEDDEESILQSLPSKSRSKLSYLAPAGTCRGAAWLVSFGQSCLSL